MTFTVGAIGSGANGWQGIVNFGHEKLEWLRRFVPWLFLPIPSKMESMQSRGRLSRLFEFFITLRPKAGIPLSKRLFQFAVENSSSHLQE
jgi:hypothetical protein